MTRVNLFLTILLLPVMFSLAACDGFDMGIDDAISGQDANVVRGEQLFNQPTIGAEAAPGCVTCHSLEEGVVILGPSQAEMATRAGQSVSGMIAADYLRTSIVEPDAHIVPGFVAGVMYPNYGSELSADEVEALVAFMMTLN